MLRDLLQLGGALAMDCMCHPTLKYKDAVKNDFVSDANLGEFVSAQLEQLIMRVSNSAELMDVASLRRRLLQLYTHTLVETAPASSHIIRDRLQYMCLTVLQQQKRPVADDVMALLESARLNTALFVKLNVMNAAEGGDSEYMQERLSGPDVDSLLSAFESLDRLRPPPPGPV